jgi:hypothetical protein
MERSNMSISIDVSKMEAKKTIQRINETKCRSLKRKIRFIKLPKRQGNRRKILLRFLSFLFLRRTGDGTQGFVVARQALYFLHHSFLRHLKKHISV